MWTINPDKDFSFVVHMLAYRFTTADHLPPALTYLLPPLLLHQHLHVCYHYIHKSSPPACQLQTSFSSTYVQTISVLFTFILKLYNPLTVFLFIIFIYTHFWGITKTIVEKAAAFWSTLFVRRQPYCQYCHQWVRWKLNLQYYGWVTVLLRTTRSSERTNGAASELQAIVDCSYDSGSFVQSPFYWTLQSFYVSQRFNILPLKSWES